MKLSSEPSNRTLLGHPKGLFILFITELWERFSFYGMRAILVLFLIDNVKGGFGWSEAAALQVYGTYLMLVYLLAIPGGFISDHYIGHRAAVLSGAFLQTIGYFLLMLQSSIVLPFALLLIAIGTGFLKPSISAMVGALYPEEDERRDSGFTIFFMGISVGMLLAAFVVGSIGEVYGWHYGFGLAGVGMLLSIGTFVAGSEYLGSVSKQSLKDVVPTASSTLVKEERDRLVLIFVCLLAVCVFYTAYEQSGGLMTLYAEKYTDRHFYHWQFPASVFTGITPAFVVLLGPLVSYVWIRLARHIPTNAIVKLGAGLVILGIGFLVMVGAALQRRTSPTGQSSLYWLVATYIIYAIGELCLSPVALSYITYLAPDRLKSSMIGAFFASAGTAGFLASMLGERSVFLGDLLIFQIIAAITFLVGFCFILFNRRLMKLEHGNVEDIESAAER